ncbi:hypothetical protein FOXB_17588 [Fusarium oxysporum f. sp. conglutinans Fo5176]|uniref:CCHC-type domain-containing protein n=1 Tax=Fusarium oxysporum (strain Fo5176) TaxID=660025 RepID=F9GG04_FUSOF|nr:hypothetical protein FOXB_17588 [Fusarium oxysporum f. sp. conglutinans Fo5176]
MAKRDKSQITCYNCSKKGYYEQECQYPKNAEVKLKWVPVPKTKTQHLTKGKSVFMVKKGKKVIPNTDSKPSTKKVNQEINSIPIKTTL